MGVFAVMGYGWYKLAYGQREKLELAREKMWSRIHLTPLLQAEEDRDQVRRWYADQAREKELLGTQSSPIIADRYVLYPLIVRDNDTVEKFAYHRAGRILDIQENCADAFTTDSYGRQYHTPLV